ncbi:MAG: alpha/beta hydrolase-fold protein [Bacteroidota bacterium]
MNKHLLRALFLIIITALQLVTTSHAQTLRGKVLQRSFLGTITNKTIPFSIYLPEGYDNSTERYPVIYHLHGIGGSYTGNQTVTIPSKYEESLDSNYVGKVIIVFPDGYSNSMWADSWSGHKPAETNIVKELIPYIDSIYRTKADRVNRIISGYSMGGFGAVKFIVKYSHLFRAAFLYDGAIHTWATFKNNHSNLALEIFNNDEKYFHLFSPWHYLTQKGVRLRDSIKIQISVGALTNYNRPLKDTLNAYKLFFDYKETGCAHNLGCVLDNNGLSAIKYIFKAVPTSIESDERLPINFNLYQNYPNPFNPITVIRYNLQAASHVTLKVYNVLGREAATLVDEYKNAGIYNSQFSILHYELSSGIYFYRLQARNFVQTKKMTLLK